LMPTGGHDRRPTWRARRMASMADIELVIVPFVSVGPLRFSATAESCPATSAKLTPPGRCSTLRAPLRTLNNPVPRRDEMMR